MTVSRFLNAILQSTITDRFQTTIPLAVRQAFQLRPSQKVSYELRTDGSVVHRPVPGLDSLFGSLKLRKPVASAEEVKRSARDAIAHEAVNGGLE